MFNAGPWKRGAVWVLCVAAELRECEGDQYGGVYSCHATVRLRAREPVSVYGRARARVCVRRLPWLQRNQYDKWLPFPQTSLHSLASAALEPRHPPANPLRAHTHTWTDANHSLSLDPLPLKANIKMRHYKFMNSKSIWGLLRGKVSGLWSEVSTLWILQLKKINKKRMEGPHSQHLSISFYWHLH